MEFEARQLQLRCCTIPTTRYIPRNAQAYRQGIQAIRVEPIRPALFLLQLDGLFQNYDFATVLHGQITKRLQAGENPKVVSERLGHATITLTLK